MVFHLYEQFHSEDTLLNIQLPRTSSDGCTARQNFGMYVVYNQTLTGMSVGELLSPSPNTWWT